MRSFTMTQYMRSQQHVIIGSAHSYCVAFFIYLSQLRVLEYGRGKVQLQSGNDCHKYEPTHGNDVRYEARLLPGGGCRTCPAGTRAGPGCSAAAAPASTRRSPSAARCGSSPRCCVIVARVAISTLLTALPQPLNMDVTVWIVNCRSYFCQLLIVCSHLGTATRRVNMQLGYRGTLRATDAPEQVRGDGF